MTEAMTHRQRAMNILHYKEVDRLPIVHFGFWPETLEKWHQEGHLTEEEARGWGDGNTADASITKKMGFDFNWCSTMPPATFLAPPFERKVIKELPDGSRHLQDWTGSILLDIPGAGSIPAEIDHLLKDRESWEEHYKHRYQWFEDRVELAPVRIGQEMVPFNEGGREFLQKDERDYPYGLFAGSMYGHIRDVIGLENISMMPMMDPELFEEILDTVCSLSYRIVEYTLKQGVKFDFLHFWEDICFKNGPLIQPAFFKEKVGPYYKKITRLAADYGIDIVSLDCDGLIDLLIPTWLENGVNTMFPMEVGTWEASIAPWREKYGKELRGVGGMNKTVFSKDRAAIEAEVERLKPLVELGGYIPCPDHRIAPDGKWDLVQYYAEKMRQAFG